MHNNLRHVFLSRIIELCVQELLLGLFYTLESETFEHTLHQGLDAVVAEVADAALMGMVNVLVGAECTGLNV